MTIDEDSNMQRPNNPVITAEQAMKITGGRTPLVPVQYEQAVRSLAECASLDEAKLWRDKADALAAWAKIYRDDKVGRQARMLKLHAYRRMGQLALEIRGSRPKHLGGRLGCKPGANKLLIDQGIDQHKARHALNLARATPEEFRRTVEAAHSIEKSASEFVGRGAPARPQSSEAWRWLTRDGGPCLYAVRASFAKRKPADIARSIGRSEAAKAREMAVEIVEWLDEFERCLPKVSRG